MTTPAVRSDVPEVLFVCVHNAGRSQMAAALLQHHAGGRVRVRSARSEPSDEIDPNVVAAMAERGSLVGCIAGALSFGEYRSGLERAGFGAIEHEPTHEVADGMLSAIVRARRPEDG